MTSTFNKKVITTSIVFIAGYDEGKNRYYTNAKKYYEAQNIQVINHLYSLDEIIKYLNQNSFSTYDKIHIVCHSNPWLGMSLKTTKKGERITLETLSKAIDNKKITSLEKSIASDTKIIFHSCGLGENKVLLKKIKEVFTTQKAPKVIASPFFNIYGGKFAGHYLAKPYYGCYPTAESPGPIALSKMFQNNYPTVNINWSKALKTRKETKIGAVYSYKFNIPVDWEFSFENKNEIPKLNNKETIMDWISEVPEIATALYKLNIPIEKYRWRSSVKNNKLIIKGKTTVICVLQPILEENYKEEYKTTDFNEHSLYQIL